MTKTLSLGKDWDAICALGYSIIDREKRALTRDAAPARARAARDNEPPAELRREQELALAANEAPGSEIWDEAPVAGPFDPEEHGIEKMADGRFRVRRKRRDRRAADAGPVLDWGSSPQAQQAGLAGLNRYYKSFWGSAPMTDNRAALRRAIESRVAAAAELEETRAALRRAEELASEAEGALAKHVDLDERISSHRGGLVGAWARSGSAGAPAVELSVPLAAEAAERDQRLETLAAARDGVAHLARAEAAGITALRRAEHDVIRHAESVVLEHCASLEQRWSAAFAEASRLAVEMRASAATWFSAAGISPRPLSISPDHRNALRMLNEADVAGLTGKLANPGAHPISTRMADWWRRLCQDADAQLDEPPATVVPLGRKVA